MFSKMMAQTLCEFQPIYLFHEKAEHLLIRSIGIRFAQTTAGKVHYGSRQRPGYLNPPLRGHSAKQFYLNCLCARVRIRRLRFHVAPAPVSVIVAGMACTSTVMGRP